MVSGKDDAQHTDNEVFPGDADEAVVSRDDVNHEGVPRLKSKILGLFDRKTYSISLLIISIPRSFMD
jgi:hypothetical protein